MKSVNLHLIREALLIFCETEVVNHLKMALNIEIPLHSRGKYSESYI